MPRHLSGSFSEPGHLPCQQAWHVVELWEVPLCSPSAPQRGSRVRAISCRKSLMLCPHKLPGYLDLGGSRTPSPGGTLTFLCRCLVESAPEQAPTRPSSTGPTRIQGLGGFLFPQDSCGCGPLHLPSPPRLQILPSSPEAQPESPATGLLSTRAHVQGVHGGTRTCVVPNARTSTGICVCPHATAPLCAPPGAPTSLMKSAISAGLVGSMRGGWGRTRLNGASRRSGGRPRGARRPASSVGWRSWLMA